MQFWALYQALPAAVRELADRSFERLIVAAGTAQQERGEGGAAPQVSEIIVPSMAAQTYEVLAKSDELMYALADTLIQTLEPDLLEKLAGEQPSVAQLGYGLSEGLEVELLKETVKAKSPLLVFRFASAEERYSNSSRRRMWTAC